MEAQNNVKIKNKFRGGKSIIFTFSFGAYMTQCSVQTKCTQCTQCTQCTWQNKTTEIYKIMTKNEREGVKPFSLC